MIDNRLPLTFILVLPSKCLVGFVYSVYDYLCSSDVSAFQDLRIEVDVACLSLPQWHTEALFETAFLTVTVPSFAESNLNNLSS